MTSDFHTASHSDKQEFTIIDVELNMHFILVSLLIFTFKSYIFRYQYFLMAYISHCLKFEKPSDGKFEYVKNYLDSFAMSKDRRQKYLQTETSMWTCRYISTMTFLYVGVFTNLLPRDY